MNTLTLKELAPYLPYGVEMNTKLKGLKLNISSLGHNYIGIEYVLDKQIKPILYPLSMLTQEIEHNGEKFVPIKKLAKIFADYSGYNDDIQIYKGKCLCYSKTSSTEFRFNGRDFIFNDKITTGQYFLYQELFKWHFDAFGLIEKGLAIDKTTI